MKAKIKVGYLFEYKAIPTQKDIEFAKLHQIKLVTILNIYSKFNDHTKIDKILSDRHGWSYNTEIKYLNYKLIKSIPITGRLLKVRKSTFWTIEKREQLDGDSNITYTCFTNLFYLKYLSSKYNVQAWVFTNKKSKPDFLLKNILHYNKFIKKGRVIVSDPVVARQCLKIRASQGHKTEFIYDKTLIPKCATKSNIIRKPNNRTWRDIKQRVLFEHDPVQQKLVCITDGTTVWRIKYYKALKRVSQFPKTITFCSKKMWQDQEENLKNGIKKPGLTTKGCKPGANYIGTGTRRERKQYLHNKPRLSRFYKEQFIGNKRILHHIRPEIYTLPFYNPKNRKQHKPSMFEKIEVTTKGIHISKFPYNKPIVITYIHEDEDGTIHHKKETNVKMINKKLIKDDPDGKDQIVICSVKDVEKWCGQEEYDKVKGEKPDWTPTISIVPTTKTKVVRKEFHLQRKQKKTKQWRHPIKDGRYIYFKGKYDADGVRLPF
jgi:hypothetical protein